jgi:hypothetical protein
MESAIQIEFKMLNVGNSNFDIRRKKITGVNGYLDSMPNVSNQLRDNFTINKHVIGLMPADPWELLLKQECPGYVIPGSCDNGHRVMMEVYCRHEWCPVCGKKWSPAHQRRFARWLPKAYQIRGMGYFVFTIPEELRSNYKTKQALNEFGHNIQKMLKEQGYSRGLRRWHFFGDRSTKYNPHLNVLVESEYLEPDKLATVKMIYATLLGVDMADVSYEYATEPGNKVHILKYVTRATFTDWRWDRDLALELREFRNQVAWGRGLWNKEPVWSLDDMQGDNESEMPGLDVKAVEALESGNCHKCGLPLQWGKVGHVSLLKNEKERRNLGAGYWELPDVKPPSGRMKIKRLDSLAYWLKICRLAGVKALPVRKVLTQPGNSDNIISQAG